MNRAILDTDILSEILKQKDPQVVRHSEAYRATFGVLTLSTVNVMEVVKGLHRLQRPQQLVAFLTAISGEEILVLDFDSARLAGQIYADLEASGQPIGRADPMIAGIAIYHGLRLISGNTAHYQRITDLGYALQVENWRQ